MFNADIPLFEPGIDKNNNGLVDIFENDEKPDYDYDKDLQGGGGSIQLNLFEDRLRFLSGIRYEFLNSNRDIKAFSFYNIANFKMQIPKFAEISAEYQLKYVADNIRNDYVEYAILSGTNIIVSYVPTFEYNRPQVVGITPPYSVEYKTFYDKMLMCNSLVNSLWAQFWYNRFKNLDIICKFKLEVNNQDISIRFDKAESFIGLINKIRYEIEPLKRLFIVPMIKSEICRRTGLAPLDFSRNSLILLNYYKFTPRTILYFGAQYTQYRDRLYPHEGYPYNADSIFYLVQIVNRARFLKYDLTLTAGFVREERYWEREPKDIINRIFISVFMTRP